MKKKRQGFTLVELLAVIVILAIILVIAIPAVLEATNAAKKESFFLYAQSLQSKAIAQYTQDLEHDKDKTDCAVYSIEDDLHLSDTGKYQGWIQVQRTIVSSGKRQVDVEVSNSKGLEYVKYCIAKGNSCVPDTSFQVREGAQSATISKTISEGYVLCANYQYAENNELKTGGTSCKTYANGSDINDTYDYTVTLSLIDDSYAADTVPFNKDMSMQAFYGYLDKKGMTIVEPICGGGTAKTLTRGQKQLGTTYVTTTKGKGTSTVVVGSTTKTTGVTNVNTTTKKSTSVQNVKTTTKKSTTNVIVGTTTKTTTNKIVGTTTKTTTNVIVGTTTTTTTNKIVGTTTKTTKSTKVTSTTTNKDANKTNVTSTTTNKDANKTNVTSTTTDKDANKTNVTTTTKTTTNHIVGTTTKTTTNQIVTVTTTTQRTTYLETTTVDPLDTSLQLTELQVKGYDIGFTPLKYYYDLDVPYEVESVQIVVTGASPDTVITVSGADNINVGANPVIVQLHNTTTGKRSFYRVFVYRAQKGGSNIKTTTKDPYANWDPDSGVPDPTLDESDASLSHLSVAGYGLPFRSDVYDYTLEINGESELQLYTRANSPGAMINVNGNENLEDGSQIVIMVQSKNGYYHKTYTIKVKFKNTTSTTTKVLQGVAAGLGVTAAAVAAAIHFVRKRKTAIVQNDDVTNNNNNNQGN